MASISQISGSLAAAQNQNTLALANFNIDFSLIKVSASEEYQVLGTTLSQRRRENAEGGPQHRTARKLGALFEEIIPQISELSEAYGKRVTEIVEHSNSKVNTKADYGPFSSHIGLDGTSIYAAVTSGSKVIALHLLACMLARAWSGPEATAIWVELVASRKADIKNNSDPNHLHGLVACTIAEQEITRSQLAAWDASARAWLRSADEVKRFEQTQLQLIIKDSGLSIGTSGTTYSSVIDAWTMAMTGLQKLILGIPQNISKASVLVGLLSWHIYPDLNVVDPMTHVKFSDVLVKRGGIITLGLSRDGASDKGVRWSLALSHLRFYGDPVAVERCIGTDSGRVTLPDLHLIALGCVISSWGNSSDIDLIATADCFVAVGECLWPDRYGQEDSFRAAVSWLHLLVAAAQTFAQSTGMERQHCIDLVEFGRRRGRHFLDFDARNFVPMFGLAHPDLLARLSIGFGDQGINASIDILRTIAELFKMDKDDCLIRYMPEDGLCPEIRWEIGYQMKQDYQLTPEYTTAIPHRTPTVKHRRDGEMVYNETHTYWIYTDSMFDPHDQIYSELLQYREACNNSLERKESLSRALLKSELRSVDGFPHDPELFGHWQDVTVFSGCSCDSHCHAVNEGSDICACKLRGLSCTSLCPCVQRLETLTNSPTCLNLRQRHSQLMGTGAHCHWLSVRDANIAESSGLHRICWNSPPTAFARRYRSLSKYDEDSESFVAFDVRNNKSSPEGDLDPDYSTSHGGRASFSFLAGDNRAGLYLSHRASIPSTQTTIQSLTNYLRSKSVDRQKLMEHFRNLPSYDMCPGSPRRCLFIDSLYAISDASKLYGEWPEATVSIAITQRPIGLAHWARSYGPAQAHVRFRARKFACIAMLETGVHDLHLDHLQSVLALASGNSIYVAEALIQDPSNIDRSADRQFVGIRRILGNLDRPGIVMLVPPQQPRIRKPDLDTWKVVQQAPFDGLPVNLFKNTSLHLSFTDFELPIAMASGAFDPEVTLLEALISIHEGRQWIADLDVLGSFDIFNKEKLLMPDGCEPDCKGPYDPDGLSQRLVAKFATRLKSIGNWDELLCCKDNLLPNEIGVVRTYNSWTSRLAALAICTMRGFSTTLLPSHRICASCCDFISEEDWVDYFNRSRSSPIILIT